MRFYTHDLDALEIMDITTFQENRNLIKRKFLFYVMLLLLFDLGSLDDHGLGLLF